MLQDSAGRTERYTKTPDRVIGEADGVARAETYPRALNFKVSSVKSFHSSDFHSVIPARDMSRDLNLSLLVVES